MHARMRGMVTTAVVALLSLSLVAPSAANATRRLKPVAIRGAAVVYSLRALHHRVVVRAEVRGPGYHRRVPVGTVRRAARRGGRIVIHVPVRVIRRARKPKPGTVAPVATTPTPSVTVPTVTTPSVTVPSVTVPGAVIPSTPPVPVAETPVTLVVVVAPEPITTPTLATPPATVPDPTPAPSPDPVPTTPGATTTPTTLPSGLQTWSAPGSKPLSDAAAAALVQPSPELRPQNTTANFTAPTADQIKAFHDARYLVGGNTGRTGDQVITTIGAVSGNFVGTTDEIFQWVSYKWGIPLDVVRAVAQNESNWRMSMLGDSATVPDASLYPAYSRISATSVYQSLGIMQVKWKADGSLHVGTEPLRWTSTAFNVDYWAANVRFFYDGNASLWFGTGGSYQPGDAWLSVGAWFQPTPWKNSGQLTYIDHVQQKVAAHAWTSPGF